MLVSAVGMMKLRGLRRELQEDAGNQFPQGITRELLVIYDVCETLNLNIFQKEEVLGEEALKYVNEYINTPVSRTKS